MMTGNSLLLRFALKFIIAFAVLAAAFEASRGTALEKFVVEDAILVPTVAVINSVTPGEHVELHERTLTTSTSRLHVTRGCEGVEMFFLLVAAILAFPASPRRRAQGFVIGLALVYILSIARLAMLDWALRYSPGAWEILHGLVLPLAPIMAIALFFLRWSARSQPVHAT
jgi:exosortase family protein XrtM